MTLGELRVRLEDKAPLLRIFGVLMMASVMRTFREEGSPAGSWPRLALSTLRKKGYTTRHKLLVLSGRLRSSIKPKVSGSVLTIGTALVYAAVQQFGSADRRGGSVGAQARVPGRSAAVNPYARLLGIKSGKHEVVDARGRVRMVKAKYQGPRQQTEVRGHERFQDIPARPYLVFRPEDPGRLAEAANAYFLGKALRATGGEA